MVGDQHLCSDFIQPRKKVFISKYARIFTNSGVKPQKKRVFIAKSAKKQFMLTNSGVITSILGASGLELHFSGTEHVTFFGAQSSLGGHSSCLGVTSMIWGGARPRNARRGVGPAASLHQFIKL